MAAPFTQKKNYVMHHESSKKQVYDPLILDYFVIPAVWKLKNENSCSVIILVGYNSLMIKLTHGV